MNMQDVGDLLDMTTFSPKAIIGVSGKNFLYAINENNTLVGF